MAQTVELKQIKAEHVLNHVADIARIADKDDLNRVIITHTMELLNTDVNGNNWYKHKFFVTGSMGSVPVIFDITKEVGAIINYAWATGRKVYNGSKNSILANYNDIYIKGYSELEDSVLELLNEFLKDAKLTLEVKGSVLDLDDINKETVRTVREFTKRYIQQW